MPWLTTAQAMAESGLGRGRALETIIEDAERFPLSIEVLGDARGVEVVDIVFDSRAVRPGALFCCLPGANTDGHRFAASAVEAGAVAVLAERDVGVAVPQLLVADSRLAMAPLAAAVFNHPGQALEVVGVTGTNGKTTMVHILRAILQTAGRSTSIIGTLSGARTTPEAPDLQRQLAQLRDSGCQSVAIEVSSHALALHRIDATPIDIAVFTNLSRDHLDFHSTMEAYFQAKAVLFEPRFSTRAVVNTDDPHGRLLLDAAQIPTTGYSLDEVSDLHLGINHSTFTWRGQEIHLPLGGRFNVSNAIGAGTVALILGVDMSVVVEGLARVAVIPGRFEVIDLAAPFQVVVDFAHTPDGLAGLLEAAQELAGSGLVHVVFGCGGDRDHTKRSSMGEVASRLADRIVLTSDNPRSEDPMAIIEEIRAGISSSEGLTVEVNRRAAISWALAQAEPGDVVLIAGKGHEPEQEIDGQRYPFDDRIVVREEYDRLVQNR